MFLCSTKIVIFDFLNVSVFKIKYNNFDVTYEYLFIIDMSDLKQVCRDPRWGRCYESYSEDPKIVQEMTQIIPGLQGEIPKSYRKGVPYVAGQ